MVNEIILKWQSSYQQIFVEKALIWAMSIKKIVHALKLNWYSMLDSIAYIFHTIYDRRK